jgi:hypothetical protein
VRIGSFDKPFQKSSVAVVGYTLQAATPEMALWLFQEWPVAVFYPLRHPMPYATGLLEGLFKFGRSFLTLRTENQVGNSGCSGYAICFNYDVK